MRHTRGFSLNPAVLKLTLQFIRGWWLPLVTAFALVAGAGWAALLDGSRSRAAFFATPSLGTAQSFAVLGASMVTNTGPTTVSGDLGVWPGTAVTGFPPGIVTGGIIHANDAVALQAQSDVTIAYNSLAGLPCNANLTGQDLGGLTLAPGVYCFNSSAQLTGTLALDAQGDPNAVFVFQIGSTLVTASNASVQVINGAQNCNAFWQVGSSATLGTGTSFIGNILALASITLNTNAILSGRALARTGAVTMDSNAITRTTCAPTLDVSFTPVTITVGGVSTKTISLSNPNTIAANITALTDTLPAGLVIATPPNAANTCGGVLTATAGGNTITLTGGAIPAGNGIIAGTCTITVNVTAALPGSYTNTLPIGALQTSNGNNSAPVSATLTVICPAIDTTITAPVAVCALSTGNAASVPNAGGSATYVWAVTGGTLTAGQGTPIITFTAGTTNPVTLNVTVTTSPGCSANGSRQVTINANPTAAAGPSQALCQTVPGPTVFTLNGTVANGTPQWSVFGSTGTAAATIVSPNSATTNVNVTGNGTVTLRLTATSNATPSCSTASADVVLTVNANPAAAAGIDQTLCQTLPGPTVFNVTGTATNGTPSWGVFATTGTALATIVSPNSATTAVNVTGNGTVTLRLTVMSNAIPNCGTATDDVVLTVLPPPLANAGIDQAACQTLPGPTVFTVTGNALNGTPATPAWTLVGTTGTAVTTILTPNNTMTGVNITGTGTVTLRFTVNSNSVPNCGISTDDVVLTVTTSAIALAGPDQMLCQTLPGPTVFSVGGTGGTPNWSVLSTTGTAAASIVSPNSAMTAVNVTGLGTVTLRLTTSNPGCGNATDDVVLTVNPNPTAAAGIDQTLCQTLPGPTVFNVSGTLTNATPSWSVLAMTGTVTAIIVSPNSAATAVNVTGLGTVTLRLTGANANCGPATDDVVLTVIANPTAAAGVDQMLCQTLPGPTVFTVTGTASGGALQWSVLATTGTATATIVSPNAAMTAVNVNGLGTVTLRLTTTSANCGNATDDVLLTINANPTAAAGLDQSLCQTLPGPTIFNVTGTFTNGAPATPAWTLVTATGTAAATILTPNNTTTGVNVTGTGTVTLRFTVNSNATPACAAATDDVVLTVNANPLAAAGVDQMLCQTLPGPTVFSVTGTATGGTPQWSVFATTGTAVANIVTPNSATTNVNVTGNGTVTLRLTVISNATPACAAATDDVLLTINANPAAAAGVDQMLCQTVPGPTVFNVTGTASGGILLWSVLATTGTATATIVSPNSATTAVNVNGLGTVTLRMTTTSANCGTATDDVLLTINALPVTTITAATGVCVLSTGNTASVPNAGVGASYTWTITGGTITAGQGTPNITYMAGNAGNVTLALTVTTAAGCSASRSTIVTVDSNCAVDVCVVKTGSALVAYETGQFTYTLSLVNFGPGVATGVTVTDTLPAGVTLVSATPSQGACSGTATLTCNLGNLANQATATIKLVVTFPMKSAGSVLCNTAVITSNQGEIAPANNTSTVCVPVEKVPPGPGPNLPPTSQVSDTKSGSVLVFPYYTSDASNPNRTNTRISITNVENNWQACLHLFFVDGATCSVADSSLCLTPNQTASFLMSDLDPGVSGYLIAVLVDCQTGCPLNINTLIGDEYVKLASGHAANLGAEAIAGLPGVTALCDSNSSTAELKFDGVMYNQLPRVLALSSLGSRADGNDTLLVINRIGGDLSTGAATLGAIFGLLYDDTENAYSFSFNAGCQFRGSLTDGFPRTTPRLTTVIPAGRSGWLKLWGANNIGLFGVALNFNPNTGANAGAFNQGRNLHKLTLSSAASLTIPVFPPSC